MKYLLRIILFIIPFYLQAQEFQINNIGVRARSLAGAYISIADDAVAAFWNPAGLSQTKSKELYFSGGVNTYFITTKIEDFNTKAYNYCHLPYDFLGLKILLANFNGHRKLMGGISIQNIIDFQDKYTKDQFSKEQHGRVNAVSFSIGYQLADSLHLGLSFRYFHGKRYFYFKDETDSQWGKDANEDSIYSGFSLPPDMGFLYKNYPFKFGMTIKFPFNLIEKNDEENYKAKIRMPWIIGVGTAYHFSQKLFISLDMEWQDSKNLYRKYIDVIDAIQNGQKEQIGNINIFQVRCGSELTLTGTWIGDIPIRAGIAYTPKYFKDIEEKQIVGSLATLGSGLEYKRFNLDFGVEYNSYLYKLRGKGSYREHDLKFIFALRVRWGDK